MSWISFVKLRVLSGSEGRSEGRRKCCDAHSTIAGTHARAKLHTMPRVLIVAYGNPLRTDDGLAWRAAAALEDKFSCSDVEIVRIHQLTPELAETVSRCEAVIFVDAAPALNGPPGEIRCAQIRPSETPSGFSHQLAPEAIVALAHQLFAVRPAAVSVTLTGECFDHGESLSSVIAAALPALVARIETLVQQLLSGKVPPDSNKA